jgi:DNA transformation protein
MAANSSYKTFLHDLLVDFGPVEIRNMFGGAGIYADGVMFAILVEDTLYLKADEVSARDFAAEDKGPFTYRPKDRRPVAMSYWEVPDRLLDDPAELAIWARRAHAIAAAGKAKRHGQSESAADRYCTWIESRYWMMASTSWALKTKIGISGCPETIPSASDSARSSTG